MDTGTHTHSPTTTADRRPVLELADGSRLVGGSAKPARLDGERDHAFTLADVQRDVDQAPQPFAGYELLKS